MVIASISASKKQAVEVKESMDLKRQELGELGLDQNLSRLFRLLVSSEIKSDGDGTYSITVQLSENK